MDEKYIRMLNNLQELYPGYDMELFKSYFNEDKCSCVWLSKEGIRKYIYYNHDLDKVVSNPIDGSYFFHKIYGNTYTLHSYLVDGGVRAFIGITNVDNGVFLQKCFDINRQEFVELPLKNGLIDDEMMLEVIKKEDASIRFSFEKYQNAIKLNNIFIVLKNLIGYYDVFDKINEINALEIDELEQKTYDRIHQKRHKK